MCEVKSFVMFVQAFGSGDNSARNEENLEFAIFLLQTRRKQSVVDNCNFISNLCQLESYANQFVCILVSSGK